MASSSFAGPTDHSPATFTGSFFIATVLPSRPPRYSVSPVEYLVRVHVVSPCHFAPPTLSWPIGETADISPLLRYVEIKIYPEIVLPLDSYMALPKFFSRLLAFVYRRRG